MLFSKSKSNFYHHVLLLEVIFIELVVSSAGSALHCVAAKWYGTVRCGIINNSRIIAGEGKDNKIVFQYFIRCILDFKLLHNVVFNTDVSYCSMLRMQKIDPQNLRFHLSSLMIKQDFFCKSLCSALQSAQKKGLHGVSSECSL